MPDTGHEFSMDDFARDFSEKYGVRNLRQEATEFRGQFLTNFVDMEFYLHTVVIRFLEVPEGRDEVMRVGILPLMQAGVMKRVIELIVREVDPANQAVKLLDRVVQVRNVVAHQEGNMSSMKAKDTEVAFRSIKHGEIVETLIDTKAELARINDTIDALYQLVLKIQPDYAARERAKARAWLEGTAEHG